jgi:hypothetical protein
MRMRAGVAAAAVLAAGLAGMGAAPAAELAAHRAVYRMTLAAASPNSGVVGAQGSMFVHFADACDGWATDNRIVLDIAYGESEAVESVWSIAAWESKDGLHYRFRSRQVRDGETEENLAGEARLSRRGGGNATFAGTDTTPETRIELPSGTLFPTAHLAALLAAAERGERRFVRAVFDGTSLDNPFEISALLSDVPDSQARPPKATEDLPPVRRWRMRLAFYAHASQEALPQFEIDGRFRDDGIVEWLEQDFGDFRLRGTLVKVELLPKPKC